MQKELKELISHLSRLDHIDMDKMDDIQLADILWLSLQIEEVEKAKKDKSIQEFLKWLEKYWNLLSSIGFSKKKETPLESGNRDREDISSDEESIPLVPKRLKDNHQFSIKIPQKKDFFISNELLRVLEGFKLGYESHQDSMELDEEATVEYFAETNIFDPKFYAQTENYYDLYLMIDISDSMYIWQDSIDIFVKKLHIFSIFRNIKLLYLDSEKEEAQIYNSKTKYSKASKLLNPEGRSLLFVLSDCISTAWSRGNMLEIIYKYQQKIPTSIINMLPRRMWKGTVLRQTNITRLTRENGVLSSDIDSMLLSFDENYFNQKILRVPVVNLIADDFKAMTNIMIKKSDSSCTGIVASKSEFINTNIHRETKERTEQQRVQEFFDHSSSTAHKLALYLSVSTHLNFPIMKMIQHNMLPNSTQLDLAEFFVGGLLDKSNKGELFTFHTGVRELLQAKLSPYKSIEILERNSQFIADNFGSTLKFSAILMHDGGDDEWTEEDKRFADMSLSVLERLGGNYSKEVQKIRRKRFGVPNRNNTTNSITPKTKSFLMGSDDGRDNEKPVHKVTIDYDFEISPYQVTVGEFKLFVKDKGYITEAEKGDGAYVWDGKKDEKKKDAFWKNPYFEQTDTHPVVCVSWNDAQEYIKWLNKGTENYRLPTEAEWEYACKAGTTTKWSFGDDEKELDKYAWYYKDSDKKTHPVGERKANPWGLYDMHGNVGEWCQDEYIDNYDETPRDGSANKKRKDKRRVLRGGSWSDFSDVTRSSDRGWLNPSFSINDVGFRLLRTLP